ncbi:DenH|uniref:Allene oxide cyclase barrel-like domain-containing protein n=1 Tax=Dendrosporobacter quercicolus TaxID=146817 RepID=A0A1G9NZH2_9FIRM|nr:hypothetical protein [Dendrosporobacter quercicolus]NSL47500.1 DenH [Dendrosporobacter quercicolus DSM 1736]SDL92022.1 hypothetical protein SAMN04488502_1011180 [Dendrosporobacter quercicolus]
MGKEKRQQVKSFEVINYIVSAEWLPVEDEEGHVMGVQKREGAAKFMDGETAQYSFVGTFDIPNGREGTANGYTRLEFEDKSLIIISWQSALPWQNGKLPVNKGCGTLVKGTGRFAGIRGESVFSGRQLKAAAEDPRGTAIANVTITYALP